MAPTPTDDRSASPDVAHSSSRPRSPNRTSSIRFTTDTNTASRSPMSRGWRESDEVTPIRSAADTPSRSYNTTEEDEARPGNSAKKTSPTNSEDAPDTQKNEELPWHKRIVEKYGSISLENKGSVARDHLALERTFLAWLRTSLAFASIGIAVTQLFRLNSTIRTRALPSQVPFSPYIGQSIPAELLPYLQQAAASAAASAQTLGSTLLDQLLLLPPAGAITPGLPASSPYHDLDTQGPTKHKLRHVGKPLGATFLAISIVILFIGFHRYFESQHWIIRGKFPASRGSIFLVAFIAGALIVASLLVVLVIAPTP